jgi:hypothetical protein
VNVDEAYAACTVYVSAQKEEENEQQVSWHPRFHAVRNACHRACFREHRQRVAHARRVQSSLARP